MHGHVLLADNQGKANTIYNEGKTAAAVLVGTLHLPPPTEACRAASTKTSQQETSP